jgi:hypothetical protein
MGGGFATLARLSPLEKRNPAHSLLLTDAQADHAKKSGAGQGLATTLDAVGTPVGLPETRDSG